jgi:hypothetical protein
MIRDVKIFLAKIKDGKGKELSFYNKKSLPSKIPPAIPLSGHFLDDSGQVT